MWSPTQWKQHLPTYSPGFTMPAFTAASFSRVSVEPVVPGGSRMLMAIAEATPAMVPIPLPPSIRFASEAWFQNNPVTRIDVSTPPMVAKPSLRRFFSYWERVRPIVVEPMMQTLAVHIPQTAALSSPSVVCVCPYPGNVRIQARRPLQTLQPLPSISTAAFVRRASSSA